MNATWHPFGNKEKLVSEAGTFPADRHDRRQTTKPLPTKPSSRELDYGEPAEMFANRRGIGLPLFFKRFDSVAKGLQFATETLPKGLINVVLESQHERLDESSIKASYEAPGYPLPRPRRKSKEKTS
jgi:hypothetical protein